MTGAHAGEMLALDGATQMYVGRSRSADIRLDETGVSRIHSRIARRDGAIWIEDMDSTNGTIVNGQPVRAVKLVPGDRIQLGPNVLLQFGLHDDAEDTLARKLFEASTRDPLTGAYNRRYFLERLESEVAQARRHDTPLSVLMIDIDHLEEHEDARDRVVQAVATLLREKIRSDETFCRYGAGTMALLVRGPLDGAATLAERLRASVEELKIPRGRRATVSIGVAETGDRGAQLTADGLVRVADTRMRRAKSLGRNRIATQ
jgi:two-component system cell cycle response regulator